MRLRPFDRLLLALAGIRRDCAGPPRKDLETASTPRRILLISTTAIGDTLFAIPALRALRQHLPHAYLCFLVRDRYFPMFRESPAADEVIGTAKGIIAWFRLFSWLRKKGFDAVLIMHEDGIRLHAAAYLAGIPVILQRGLEGPLAWCVSKEIRHNEVDAVDQRLDCVRAILGKRDIARPRMSLPVDNGSAERIRAEICSQLGAKYLIGFQPGAARKYKMWPKQNFVELGERVLSRSRDPGVVILGAASESALGDSIKRGLGDRAVNMCGRIPVESLATNVRALDLLVTNDTGTLHIAVAVETPTISLFVPTNPQGTGPAQDRELHTVIAKERPCGDECVTKRCPQDPGCMDLITVDEVFDRLLAVMRQSRRQA